MKLSKIEQELAGKIKIADGVDRGLEIGGVAYDSRKVKVGDLFVAISGTVSDGHKYLEQARQQGAVCAVVEHPVEGLPADFPLIFTDNSRITLSLLAALWYDYPDRKMRLIGITGTNGKTTTTYLIKWLLEQAGHKTGLIGTIKNYAGDKELDSTHTTPESWEIYQIFAAMRDESCDCAVMEVSSHALKQGRVASCDFDGVVFSNLTQDHLDYHLTLDDYRQSKAKLFTMPALTKGGNKYAVINIDDPAGQYYASLTACRTITYGENQQADLRFYDYQHTLTGGRCSVSWQGKAYRVEVPLFGKFNLYNSLAALGVALAEGLPIEDCLKALKRSPQVAGRMELIHEGQDFTVAVDYAHTPDGLLNVLAVARETQPQRLIVVFGCGGDRDNGKRPIMGRIAGEKSDFAIITSDNPRTEDPLKIIEQIRVGMDETEGRYLVEADRRSAIFAALQMAKSGDMIVIAGKGHEDYQLVNGEVLHFDDREVVREILRQKQQKQS